MHEPRPPSPTRLCPTVLRDPWERLRLLTPSRIALGRAGHALPTTEVLAADEAHARARAAVHARLDVAALSHQLNELVATPTCVHVRSAASSREQYLLRPDLGRRLSADSRHALTTACPSTGSHDLAVVIADGLSTTAVARHAVPVVAAILAAKPTECRLAPLVIASEARVALGDEIGQQLHVKLVAVLIGERPGLSCQESLGVYLTWHPRPGRHDAERNCLSNIHPEGMSATEAATRLWWLAGEAERLQTTGIDLKDRSSLETHPPAPQELPDA